MASQNISVEEFVVRGANGYPDTINYSGIYNVMKSKLGSYYNSNNYKGVCNTFYGMGAKLYKEPYGGELGGISGSLYIVDFKGNNLSLFLAIEEGSKTSDETSYSSMLNSVVICGDNNLQYPVISVRVISVSCDPNKNSKEELFYTIYDDTYENITISRSPLYSFDSTIKRYVTSNTSPITFPPKILWGYDNVVIKSDGSYGSWYNCKRPWNSTNLEYHNYAESCFKEIYKKDLSYDWRTALPIQYQTHSVNGSQLAFQDWYYSPMPIISMKPENDPITSEKIGAIIDNGEWSDERVKYPIDTKTNWKIYVDGTKLPNYKILWENKDIEDSKDTDNARIQIQYAEVDPEYPVELRVNELIHETNFTEYNDGNYKTNFKTLYEGAWGEVYDESIMSNLPKQSVWLLLQLDYYKNGITTVLPTQSSTKMAVLLNPSGKSLYSYADVWNTDGSTDGSTIRVITDKGSGEGDDGYQDDTDKGEEDITDGASNSIGVLTTTYGMTIERLNQLGGFLWGANIFDEFSLVNSNPIENIISCKNIPISLSGTDEIIHLGNVDTGTNGSKVSTNFSTLNVGQIALPTKYNSFLDFAPYTKVTIYLPYIGFKEIDATIAIGKTLKVAYVADVITGGCIAQIFINGVRFYEFSGEMGVDIPITASNRAQVEASYISNAVGMGASLASGNITGAVDSVLASATAKYNYSSTDTPNPNCVASVNRTCYVIIERPTYQELSQFNHTKGKMCNLSKTIGSLKGFTICDANIDLKGITATEQEKQEISNILSSGFFA